MKKKQVLDHSCLSHVIIYTFVSPLWLDTSIMFLYQLSLSPWCIWLILVVKNAMKMLLQPICFLPFYRKAFKAFHACGHWKGVPFVPTRASQTWECKGFASCKWACGELQAFRMPVEDARITKLPCNIPGAIGYCDCSRMRCGFVYYWPYGLRKETSLFGLPAFFSNYFICAMQQGGGTSSNQQPRLYIGIGLKNKLADDERAFWLSCFIS